MGLKRVDKFLNGCGMCGACYGRGPDVPHNWREINPEPAPVHRCPSLEYYKFRTFTAMDRISLATIVEKEGYPITDALKEVFYTCMLCGVCREICGLFDPVDIVLAAREEIVERTTLLPAHDALLKDFKTYGNPWLRPATERGKWLQNLGGKDLTNEKVKNLFFVGCAAALRPGVRRMAEKTATTLKRAGIDFMVLGADEKCCGHIPKAIGDRETYIKYETDNMNTFKKLGIKKIITSCPGCLVTLRGYPKGEWEVVHSTDYIDQLIKDGKLGLAKQMKTTVTYHDPCDLGRGARVFEPPRNIIRSMPGVELVEMPRHGRWSYCCGAGGLTASAFPDFSSFTAKDRVQEAVETGAQILLTACPQCYTTLTSARDEFYRHKIEIRDLVDFLSESLK